MKSSNVYCRTHYNDGWIIFAHQCEDIEQDTPKKGYIHNYIIISQNQEHTQEKRYDKVSRE